LQGEVEVVVEEEPHSGEIEAVGAANLIREADPSQEEI